VALATEAEGMGEVVAAAGGNYKQWQLKADELIKMAMDCAVAAEEEYGIGFSGIVWQTYLPGDDAVGCERLEGFLGTSLAQDGGGSHVRVEISRIANGVD
jgi:hypothetical protein